MKSIRTRLLTPLVGGTLAALLLGGAGVFWLVRGSLLTQLDAAMERERLFTDAASHELRTPLAELHAVTEVVERWPDNDRPIKALHEAKMIGEEMQRMVDALLVLSRSRGGDSTDVSDSILVAPIVDRTLSQLNAVGSTHDLRMEVELDKTATWPASPQAIERHLE